MDDVQKVEGRVVGSRLPREPIKVTQAEQVLYGVHAESVRRAGNLAAAANALVEEVAEALQASREADGFTTGERDELGWSEHTAWCEDWFDKVWSLRSLVNTRFTEFASGAAKQWQKQMRAGHDVNSDTLSALAAQAEAIGAVVMTKDDYHALRDERYPELSGPGVSK